LEEGNRFELTVRIAASDGLRHTPSGLPSLRLRVAHASRRQEGGRERAVELETEVVAFGDTAAKLAKLPIGDAVRLTGFLDRKGVKYPTLELHVTDFEYSARDSGPD
jgi:primosomal replication protein N